MMTISIGDALKAWWSTKKEKSGAAQIAAFNAAVRSNLNTSWSGITKDQGSAVSGTANTLR
jgi:hypothetical protein